MKPESRLVAGVCLILVVLVLAVFGQTAGFQFVNYDDKSYVYENPVVQKGLTLEGAVWALTYGRIGHWHPLTWLTHMADCQFYGLWAGGHHLTNVVLHALAAVLLFLALKELTGNLWRSACVASLFAVHPLRAESVAWIAERKDVLSGLFFMLTLWSYGRYAHQPTRWRFALVALAFGLGLLSKNMLVTLPFVLLLLDWWPLGRLGSGGTWVGLAREKIPLFLLSLGSCVATALVPEKVEADRIPFLERTANAVVSYGIYLRQMAFPSGLAIPYLNPPTGVPWWEVGLALIVLGAISITVLVCRHKQPFLLMGWLWYLGMLVPAIGLIQISYYAHADRYTYLPGIGLVLAATWAVGDLSLKWKHREAVLASMMAVVIGVLMACAWKQTRHWKDSEALWTHTLACTKDNYMAHYNLGLALDKKGTVNDAIFQFREALQIKPDHIASHIDLGIALFQNGRPDEAISQLRMAVQLNPNYEKAQNNLGNALMQKGELDEAIPHLQSAVQIDPDYVNAQNNLGSALLRKGDANEALAHFQRALQIEPDDPATQNNLAWVLATCAEPSQRDGKRAVELAERAGQLTRGENPFVLSTLAAAYAESGRFTEAVKTAQDALQVARAQSKTALVASLQAELKFYEAGSPYHGTAPAR